MRVRCLKAMLSFAMLLVCSYAWAKNCPQCQSPVLEHYKFCRNCGRSLFTGIQVKDTGIPMTIYVGGVEKKPDPDNNLVALGPGRYLVRVEFANTYEPFAPRKPYEVTWANVTQVEPELFRTDWDLCIMPAIVARERDRKNPMKVPVSEVLVDGLVRPPRLVNMLPDYVWLSEGPHTVVVRFVNSAAYKEYRETFTFQKGSPKTILPLADDPSNSRPTPPMPVTPVPATPVPNPPQSVVGPVPATPLTPTSEPCGPVQVTVTREADIPVESADDRKELFHSAKRHITAVDRSWWSFTIGNPGKTPTAPLVLRIYYDQAGRPLVEYPIGVLPPLKLRELDIRFPCKSLVYSVSTVETPMKTEVTGQTPSLPAAESQAQSGDPAPPDRAAGSS